MEIEFEATNDTLEQPDIKLEQVVANPTDPDEDNDHLLIHNSTKLKIHKKNLNLQTV